MKLWEVMKKLDENPNKRFKHELGSIIGFADNVLQWLEKDGEIIEPFLVRDRRSGTGICHNTGDDWQEVKQPVTWQEAIQAWADGKNISYSYMGYDKRFDFEDSNAMMSIEKVKNADWYVED